MGHMKHNAVQAASLEDDAFSVANDSGSNQGVT